MAETGLWGGRSEGLAGDFVGGKRWIDSVTKKQWSDIMERFDCMAGRYGLSGWVRLVAMACAVAWMVAGTRGDAAILGINTPVTSFASIQFDDTNSIAPPAGITTTGPNISPWNGSLITLPLTTDPNTLDQASGDLFATFAGNNYGLTFNNLFLSQPGITTTGFATLAISFSIEFQLDALGLPAQATLFPTFLLTGTVQTPPGSFAAFAGSLDYYGVNTAGTVSLLDSVAYSGLWTTPGPFTAVVTGVPTAGTTPALMPSTFLQIDGSFKFQVDPATIGGYSVMAVPEPGTLGVLIGGLGVPMLSRWRSFKSRCS